MDIIGVVVNAVSRRGSESYGYNYNYHYKYRSAEYRPEGESYYTEEDGATGDEDGGATAAQPIPSKEPDPAEKPA